MEIDKKDLDRRLNSSKNLINSLCLNEVCVTPDNLIVLEKTAEVHTPKVESKELRVLAGSLAHFDKVSNVAESLNLTEQQVKSSKNSTSPEIKKRVKDTVDEVSELALTKLMDTLGLLNVDSMLDLKPVDISKIASNLSRVHSNVKRADQVSSSPMFVIHAPVMNTVNNYETVNI